MYKAIPIEDYYVVVSDEEAKIGDYILDDGAIFFINEINALTGLGRDGKGNTFVLSGQKVIAQSKPVHEGIPLFDAPKEWGLVDVEELTKKYANNNFQSCNYHYEKDTRITDFDAISKAFKSGYLKHAETHKWTDEDMQKCFMAGAEFAKNIGLNMINPNLNLEEVNFFKYSQSLKKPKVYEVQIEMEEVILVKNITNKN